jgi:hypothetical protein
MIHKLVHNAQLNMKQIVVLFISKTLVVTLTGEGLKFRIVMFYKSKESLDDYLQIILSHEEPQRWIVGNDKSQHIEFEHIEIFAYNRFPSDYYRGQKCDLVFIESAEGFGSAEEFEHFKNHVWPSMIACSRFPMNIQIFQRTQLR